MRGCAFRLPEGEAEGRKKGKDMLRAMDSAVAGLRAHQNKMDVVGHNIANVNTFGFKAQTYTFIEAMYQTSTASTGHTGQAGGVNAAQYGYGTLMGSIGMDMTASTPSYTGGFNASIEGQGFFITRATPHATGGVAVGGGTGGASFKGSGFDYTRVGQFRVDSEGYITDANGNFVFGFRPNATGIESGDDAAFDDLKNLYALRAPMEDLSGFSDAAGAAVQLSSVSVDKNGLISASVSVPKDKNDPTKGTEPKTIYLGKVAIATFQNPEGLTKAGNNYYNSNERDNTGAATATPAGGAISSLMPGYIEASNVDLAKEFAEMITTHRGFQANSKMITVSDEMLSDLVAMKR